MDDKFQWLDDAELPMLVLGFVYSEIAHARDYEFKDPDRWRQMDHQTAGHSCHHHYIEGTTLKPRPKIADLMRDLDKLWLETDVWSPAQLESVLTYRRQLQQYGLDCNITHHIFEEAIYPIDCDQESLKIVTEEEFPDDLDELIKWKEGKLGVFDRFAGCLDRWKILILGRNCD